MAFGQFYKKCRFFQSKAWISPLFCLLHCHLVPCAPFHTKVQWLPDLIDRMRIVSGFLTAVVLGTWVVFTGISEPREQRKGRGKLGYIVLATMTIHQKSDFRKPMEDIQHTSPHVPGHKTFPSVWVWDSKKSMAKFWVNGGEEQVRSQVLVVPTASCAVMD